MTAAKRSSLTIAMTVPKGAREGDAPLLSDEAMLQYIVALGGSGQRRKVDRSTDILIAHDCSTDKFRWGRNLGIKIVRLEWLVRSFKEQQFVETGQFQIKERLYKLRIAVVGFQYDRYIQLKQTLDGLGALTIRCKAVDQPMLYEQHALLVSPDLEQNFRDFDERVSVLTLEWLGALLETSEFVAPCSWAINRANRNLPSFQKLINRKQAFLKKLNQTSLSQRRPDLSGCIIYLKDTPDGVEQSLVAVISICSGFVSHILDELVTHVVLDDPEDRVFTELKRSMPHVFFVRVDWLMDCMKAQKRLSQINYYTIPFNSSNSRDQKSEDLRMSFPSQKRKDQPHHSKPVLRIRDRAKGTLFQGLKFQVQPSQRHKLALAKEHILNEKGLLIEKIPPSDQPFYLLLADGQASRPVLQSYRKNYEQCSPISPRWVFYCVENKTIAKVDFDFRPCLRNLPAPELVKLNFALVNFQIAEYRRFKRFVEDLGARVVTGKSASHTLSRERNEADKSAWCLQDLQAYGS